MDNEPYRDLTHDEACDLIATEARITGHRAIREFRLPNGKIADVLVRDHRYLFTIYEVKTVCKPSLMSEAIGKYGRFCNFLWFAVPGLVMQAAPRIAIGLPDFPQSAQVGLMGVHRDSLAKLREPIMRPIYADNLSALSRSVNAKLSAGEARLL